MQTAIKIEDAIASVDVKINDLLQSKEALLKSKEALLRELKFFEYEKAFALIVKACAIWQIDQAALRVRTRKWPIPTQRQILANILHSHSVKPLKNIAVRVGLNDHSDVIHAINKLKGYLSVNDPLVLKYYEPVKHLFKNEEALQNHL